MTKYPSDKEIKQMVTKRKRLAQELIGYLMLTGQGERNKRFKQLVSRYGQAEVDRELASFRERANLLSNPDGLTIFFSGIVALRYSDKFLTKYGCHLVCLACILLV